MICAIAVMMLIIPLSVWAGSGSWRHGLQAFVAYLKIMGCITGAGLVLAGIFWLASLGAS
ncbi:MAG TPA: hypothetical protein DCX52_14075 [Massilia sp.]|nr:hypothetical protein [Massilia sp.]